jgi:uncharacterized protein
VSDTLPMPIQRGFALIVAIALALSAMVPLASPAPIRAVSADIVISQVYGGGGNSGATYTHDFIELFNRGTEAVDVTGWSVQYASATGTSWQVTALNGTIEPGAYYLVQQAQGAGGTTPLPTPDASGSIAMSATNGKVALSRTSTALTGSCPLGGDVVDFVGFGSTANCFEGSGPTDTLSNTTAALRAVAGCQDTDDNADDFSVGAPTPRNSASPANSCDPTAPTDPTGSGSATPPEVLPGEPTLLSVDVTPGTNPESTGITVSADLTAIGGDGDQAFTSTDGLTFTFEATVASDTADGLVSLPVSIADAEGRSGTTTIQLIVGSVSGGNVVISQVYGGGGNSGATYTHDFIELYNRTDDPINLNGWSVQYASATGSSWAVTPLSGSIQPGGYYLVQQAAGAGGTTPLPTPDAVGSIAMAAGAGKVALSSGTAALSGTCPTSDVYVDFVGYGSTATCYEGSGPTATLSNTTAALRKDDGAQDTNDNAADFTTGDPNPRNSGTGDNGGGDPEPVDGCVEPTHFIYEIQGDGAATPIPGTSVVVRGVVTADFTSGGASGIPANQGLRGFFLEAIPDDRDEDPLTSEGIFVFDGVGTFAGDVGDSVSVAGTAGEFGGVTQITADEIADCDVVWELPPAAELPLPVAPGDRATVLEPLESMRVTHPELTVVEFFQLERFGEIRLSADGVLQTPTNVHLPNSEEAVQLTADNAAATIILDDGRTGQNLNRLDSDDLLPYVSVGGTLRIGDQLRDHVTILHFGFGQWRLQPVDIDAITEELATNRTRPRPESPPDVGGTLKVASFNVLNYFDGDGQGGGFPNARGATTPSELARQTEKLVDAITRLEADIYGLIEIENDGGEFQALRTLVEALNAEVGAEVYRFVDTGVIGTDAIKQAFIYDRRTVRPVGDFAILTSDVDPRFDDTRSRPALAQTFTRLGTGERVTVVVNHFKSKGQSGLTDTTDPDFDQGDGQGFWNATRTASAEALADWLATNPTGVESLGSLIIGDLNAYGREDPIRALEAAGFEDQLIRYTDGIPYTYTFDGQQGTLDTALVGDDLAGRVTGAAVWHINADEVPAIDYQESVGVSFNQRFRTAEIAAAYYDPSAFRSSDHDPVLIGLDLGRSSHPGRPGG